MASIKPSIPESSTKHSFMLGNERSISEELMETDCHEGNDMSEHVVYAHLGHSKELHQIFIFEEGFLKCP